MGKYIGVLGIVGVLVIGPGISSAATYVIQDLGSLGESSSFSEDINSSGQVAGFRTLGSGSSAVSQSFRYTDPSGNVYLTTPDGAGNQAYAINDAGRVAGYYYLASGRQNAYIWTVGTGIQDLGTLESGLGNSYANDINDAGQVCGVSDTGAGSHAFLYTGGAMTDLGTGTFGGTQSKAYGMNNAGQVVGCVMTAAGANIAFVTDSSGNMQDLGATIAAEFPGTQSSKAYNINDAGEVVGQFTANGQTHAFLWDPATGIVTDLGGVSANAESINDSGAAVGESMVGGQYHAILWQNGTMTDLSSLINPGSDWTLSLALDINDAGQIVGAGTYGSEGTRAFLLTPVPEPISMIFFGTGLVAVGGFVARRRMARKA